MMPETDGAAAASEPERDDREAIREEFERLRADMAVLASCEAQLAAGRHETQLRRRAVDVAGPLAIAFTLLTAFGLANAAAVYALSNVMPDWAAALVLAGAWILVGALLAFALRVRADRGEGWAWWKLLAGGTPEGRRLLEERRARAAEDVRASLERLAAPLSRQAASAAVPVASHVASEMAGAVAGEVAGGALDVGADLIEGSDELIESMTVEMPGGGLVNQVWDVVLTPGRWGIKVATTVLKRPPPGE